MSETRGRLAIFGSTGSIGRNALEVARIHADKLRVVALSAHQRLDELAAQAEEFRPRWVVATEAEAARQHPWQLSPGMELQTGDGWLEKLAAHPEVDIVLVSIVGAAGLQGAWSAVAAGKRLALANKEALVIAGPLLMELAASTGASIVPIDSEHSAIFQTLQAADRGHLRRVVLTASGGPFRDKSPQELREVTVEQALAHPTWNMGPKITIDSATMMNKALEMIEARWLFDLRPEQIQVVIHPQSVVHSMVEFQDGSILAQLSRPDMRLPIQYALSFPQRWSAPSATYPFAEPCQWDFAPADESRFPALTLGWKAARDGGTAGAVLNAANEEAVRGFLNGELGFTEIVEVCRAVLENHSYQSHPTLEQLVQMDQWARKEVTRWVLA